MTGEGEAGVGTGPSQDGNAGGSGRWSSLTWAARALVATTAIALTSLAVLMVVSLSWDRSWDASIMEYIASLINEGARPYRDIFDMNFPGAYLFYSAGQRLTGRSDLGFRLRDLVVLLGALALLHRLMRRFPWPTAPMAVVLVAVQYLAVAGGGGALQRDWLVAVAVLVAIVLLLGEPSTWRLLLGGVALGAAVSVKPNAALMVLVVPTAVFGSELVTAALPGGGFRPALAQVARRSLGRMGFVLAGATIAVAAALGWVARSGGWSDFVWIVRHYMGPYSLLDGGGIETGSRWVSLVQVFELAIDRPDFLLFVLGAPVLLLRRRPRAEFQLLVVLVAVGSAGFLQALSAGKGWDYHYWTWTLAGFSVFAVAAGDVRTGRVSSWRRLSPWVSPVTSGVFLCGLLVWLRRFDDISVAMTLNGLLVLLMAAIPLALLAIGDLLASFGPTRALVPRLVTSSVIALLLSIPFLVNAGLALHVAMKGVQEVAPSSEHVIADVLEQRMSPDDRVQILATVGGKEAALRAGIRPATPFIYDFHFFHDVGSPVNEELRARFMRDWRRNPPEFVVVYDGAGTWSHRATYEQLEDFADLADALAAYSPVFKNAESEVLMRRGHG